MKRGPKESLLCIAEIALLNTKRGKTIAAREKSHQGKELWLEEKPP